MKRRHRQKFRSSFLDEIAERPPRRRTDSETARLHEILNSLPKCRRVESEAAR